MDGITSKRLLAEIERAKGRPPCFLNVVVFNRDSRVSGTPCGKCDHFKDCGSHVSSIGQKIKTLHRTGCFGYEDAREAFSKTTCKSCDIANDCDRTISTNKQLAVVHKMHRATTIATGNDTPTAPMASPPAAVRVTPKASTEPSLPTSPSSGAAHPTAPVAAGKSTHTYRFPDENPKYKRLLELGRTKPVEQLIEWIEKLSHGRSAKSAGKTLPYEQVRDALCATSIALNEKGWPAPKFRPLRKPPRVKGLAAGEATLSNDRQVIDLNWLKQHEVVSATAAHQALFEGPNFDFRRASQFVATVGKANLKAKVLGLTDRQQLVLGVLHSDEMRDRWRTIEAAVRRGDIALREYAEQGKARLDKKDIPGWMNAFKALAIAKGDVTSARGVYQAITGKSISRGLMERRRQALERGGARLP